MLVDLLPVVKSAIVLGESSYAIKKVEHLYMERRKAGVTNAGVSVVAYLNWQLSGEPMQPGLAPEASPKLQAIEDYNVKTAKAPFFCTTGCVSARRSKPCRSNPSSFHWMRAFRSRGNRNL